MDKELVALNDRVIIKPIEDDLQSSGNIIVPDLGKEKPELGEVIDVGPGRMSEYGVLIKPYVNKGDIVLVPKVGTLRIEVGGEEYYITSGKEILAKIKNK